MMIKVGCLPTKETSAALEILVKIIMTILIIVMMIIVVIIRLTGLKWTFSSE